MSRKPWGACSPEARRKIFLTRSGGISLGTTNNFTRKAPKRVPSIKQVLISLRDPNGIAVRPSGFDCVRPCHSERSGAESNCEAAPSKAKVESRADSAQDDTQGATPSEKITKGVRTIVRTPFHTSCSARYSVLHLLGILSGGNEPSPAGEGGPR